MEQSCYVLSCLALGTTWGHQASKLTFCGIALRITISARGFKRRDVRLIPLPTPRRLRYSGGAGCFPPASELPARSKFKEVGTPSKIGQNIP